MAAMSRPPLTETPVQLNRRRLDHLYSCIVQLGSYHAFLTLCLLMVYYHVFPIIYDNSEG